MIKNLPAVQEMQETQVQSLGQEEPLEEGMAIHSSILAWEIPWTEEPGRLRSMGSKKSQLRLGSQATAAATRMCILTLICRCVFSLNHLSKLRSDGPFSLNTSM